MARKNSKKKNKKRKKKQETNLLLPIVKDSRIDDSRSRKIIVNIDHLLSKLRLRVLHHDLLLKQFVRCLPPKEENEVSEREKALLMVLGVVWKLFDLFCRHLKRWKTRQLGGIVQIIILLHASFFILAALFVSIESAALSAGPSARRDEGPCN